MRRYPDRPVIGVGAVVVDGGRVVLVKRASEPLKGEWSLPGGAVEIGETLADAVVREVWEETGLEVRVGPVVEVLDRVHRSADGRVEFHFVIVDYLCTPRGGRLAAGSDAEDARWASIDELGAYRVNDAATAVIVKGLELASEAVG